MPEPIYLDHAATTPVRPEVLAAMQPFYGPRFGNPSSTHRWGREARTALDEARERVARCLGANPDEVCFTSGGTEGDNLAILGAWRMLRASGRNAVVTSPIEHKAVLQAVHQAAKEGAEERFLRVDQNGVTTLDSGLSTIRSDTALCSVMWVNNEIGTIQPIAELAALATFSVPGRRPRSCEPPKKSGSSGVPRRMYIAPIPLGAPILWPLIATKSNGVLRASTSTFPNACTPSDTVLSRPFGRLTRIRAFLPTASSTIPKNAFWVSAPSPSSTK